MSSPLPLSVSFYHCLSHNLNGILCFLSYTSFETLAAARNIKEVNAERITPIVPESVVVQHSQESENVPQPPAEEPELKTSFPVHRTLCSVVPHIGVKACMEIMSCNANFIKNTTLYNMIGQHGVHINIARGKYLKSKLYK